MPISQQQSLVPTKGSRSMYLRDDHNSGRRRSLHIRKDQPGSTKEKSKVYCPLSNLKSWIPKIFIGQLNIVASDGELVSIGTKVFIICGPAHIHLDLLRKIAPFVEKNAFVGTLYGQGGFDWMANHVLGSKIKSHNITLFGLQNIPSICKIRQYGESVNVIGPKNNLYHLLRVQRHNNHSIRYACSFPVERRDEVCRLMDNLFDIPTVTLPNFLSITLSPSNQIIHPGEDSSIAF